MTITSPRLSIPLHLCIHGQRIISRGIEYVPIILEWVPPKQSDEVQNIEIKMRSRGSRITTHIDQSRGGEGSVMKYEYVLASDPDQVELTGEVDISQVSVDGEDIVIKFVGDLSHLRQTVPITYTNEKADGL